MFMYLSRSVLLLRCFLVTLTAASTHRVAADAYDTMRQNWFNNLPSTTTVAASGANCAWRTTIVGLYGVITKNSKSVAAASAQFGALTAYVTAPEGFYTDGSYIGQGSLSYNGGYGLYMLEQFAGGYYLFNPTALSPLSAGSAGGFAAWLETPLNVRAADRSRPEAAWA